MQEFVGLNNIVFVQDAGDERHMLMRPIEMSPLDELKVRVLEKVNTINAERQLWKYDSNTKVASKQ